MVDISVRDSGSTAVLAPPPARPRVVDVVVDQLFRAGVRHVFGVGGVDVGDIYDAVDAHPGMTAVVAKRGFAAAAMAYGYARVGGRPHPPEHPLPPGSRIGVVVAPSGGDCLDLAAGLGESYASRVPVVALVGQPPAALDGLGSSCDGSGRAGTVDVAHVLQAVSVFYRRAQEPAQVPGLVAQALDAASRLSGPAVVIVPKDVQQTRLDATDLRALREVPIVAQLQANGLGLTGFAAELAKAAPAVVILAGDEVGRHEARAELADLARVLGAAVAVAPDAKDVMSPADRHLVGVAGSMGHPQVAEALRRSKVCLLVGTRAPVVVRCGIEANLEDIHVLSLGERPPYVEAAHLLTTDLRGTLRALCKTLRPISRHCQPPAPSSEQPSPPAPSSEQPSPSAVTYAEALRELDEAIGPGADIVADTGNIGAACVHYLPAREHGKFVVSLGMDTVGYSFGAGIGCAVARGGRTFVIAGDGAFFAHGMEMRTAIEHDLPVTFVVCDHDSQARIGAGIAAMFPQIIVSTATSAAELREALQKAGGAFGPAFVEIVCDPDEIPLFASAPS